MLPVPAQPRSVCRHTRVRAMATDSPSSPAHATSSIAELIFAEYKHPKPSGTAKLAEARKVPVRELSIAYGHILAASIQQDIPTALNASLAATTLYDALVAPEEPNVDMSQLSSLITRACDLVALEDNPLDEDTVDTLSTLYARMLASSIRLSAMEFEAGPLTTALQERLSDKLVPFPMERAAYDDAFSSLQDCAANILGTASVDAADAFFKSAASNPDITDIQNDGYILALLPEEVPSVRRAIIDDSVCLAARARLLDGRHVLAAEPNPDVSREQQIEDGLKVTLSSLPPSFSCGLVGMAVGDKRTIFYHPYAACEILPLFLSAEQIPPQAGLVLDIYLLQIE